MPGRNGTGPKGQGKGTGWGMGNCEPPDKSGSQKTAAGNNQFRVPGGSFWNGTFGRLLNAGASIVQIKVIHRRKVIMPRMDRTGPVGTGPIGRGIGPCGYGQAGRGMGRGFRRGGMGRGFSYPVLSQEEDKGILESQKSWLESQLEAVTKQIQGLEKTKED